MTSYREQIAALAGLDAPAEDGLPFDDGGGSATNQLPLPVRLRDVSLAAQPSHADRFLVAGDLNALVGEGGTSKTAIACHIAAANVLGESIFGRFRIRRSGPVLYLSAEDSAGIIRNRIEATAVAHEWDREAIRDGVFIIGPEQLINAGEDPSLDSLAWQLHLAAAIEATGATLFIAEPLADLMGRGEENSNTDARRIMRGLRHIVSLTGVTVLVGHHAGKPAEGREKRHRVRGASAFINAFRQVWYVESADGGARLEAVKANRFGRLEPVLVSQEIEADPDSSLWRRARFTVDQEDAVTPADVLVLLRLLAESATPPNSRECRSLLKERGLGTDRADSASATAKHHGWIESTPGERNEKFWHLSDAGRARLLLSQPERVCNAP